jgi:Uma2 family endonuclease
MVIQDRLLTNEAFREFENSPENQLRRFELIEGILFEMPSPSPLHGLIISQILYLLMQYLAVNNIGYALADNNDFELAPRVILKPDVAYIAKVRLPKIPKHFRLAPDLAVEVVSPSNSASEMLDKVTLFLRYGTIMVWLVYPDDKMVCVYRLAADGSLNLRKFNADDLLDGGEVLPGFSVIVRDIFPPVEVE